MPKTHPDISDLSHYLRTPRQLADGWAAAVGGPVRRGRDGGGYDKVGVGCQRDVAKGVCGQSGCHLIVVVWRKWWVVGALLNTVAW